MTEEIKEPDNIRIDLHGLDATPDVARAEDVIAGAMSRINAIGRRPIAPRLVDELARWSWQLAAAAAIVIVVAGGVVITQPAPRPFTVANGNIESQLIDWASTGHTPTNAELLTAFRGIAR